MQSLALKMCPESIPTVSIVNRCPSNATEWVSAAKRKSCNDLRQLQRCTAADDFVYHCILNKDATMLLEVCAPTHLMSGKYENNYNVPNIYLVKHWRGKIQQYTLSYWYFPSKVTLTIVTFLFGFFLYIFTITSSSWHVCIVIQRLIWILFFNLVACCVQVHDVMIASNSYQLYIGRGLHLIYNDLLR